MAPPGRQRLVLRSGALLLYIRIVGAQTVAPTPASIQDLSSPVPVAKTFSFEPEIQNGVHANSTNGNPFAYEHATQIRLWLYYDAISDATITSGVSYIYYYTVPGTSYMKHPEWRFTTYGTLRQVLSGSSLYEQLRFELLNFRASNGICREYASVLAKTFIFPKADRSPIWDCLKKPSCNFPSLLTRVFIFRVLDSSPAMGSSTGLERGFCWDSRQRQRFRAVDRQ